MRPVLLAFAVLPACVSPVARTAPAYIAEIAPLLQANGLLADRVLVVAAKVHDGTLEVGDAAIAWRDDIVPLAVELSDQAALTEPPVEWATRHDDLVDIWSDRAHAYDALATAMSEADIKGWNAARAASDDAKLREEAWFKAINAEIAPTRITLDQLP